MRRRVGAGRRSASKRENRAWRRVPLTRAQWGGEHEAAQGPKEGPANKDPLERQQYICAETLLSVAGAATVVPPPATAMQEVPGVQPFTVSVSKPGKLTGTHTDKENIGKQAEEEEELCSATDTAKKMALLLLLLLSHT